MKPDSRIAFAAAALLLAGTGGAALAHPHPDGEGEKVKSIVIVEDGRDGKRHAEGERVRRFEIIRDGEHHASGHGPRVRRFEALGHGALVDCDGGDKVVEESAGEDGKKTKVVICTRGDGPTAATAERIERALERIRGHEELSDEQKARIESALRSAMDRARTAR